MLYFIVFAALIAYLVYVWLGSRYTSKNPWQHFFDGTDISATDFYELVEMEIKSFNIPDVSYDRETFFRTHIASMRQEYLKVRRNEFVVYICAAKFGKGTFISEWMCVWRERFINRIPVISKLLGKARDNKSFYQIDTEAMFRSAVHEALLNVIDTFTEEKGMRGLSEAERRVLLS